MLQLSRKCLASVSQLSRKCLASVSQVSRKCLASVSQCLASVSQVSRSVLQVSRKCPAVVSPCFLLSSAIQTLAIQIIVVYFCFVFEFHCLPPFIVWSMDISRLVSHPTCLKKCPGFQNRGITNNKQARMASTLGHSLAVANRVVIIPSNCSHVAPGRHSKRSLRSPPGCES